MRRTQLPRIVSVLDVDDLYVACDPKMTDEGVAAWLAGRNAAEVLEEAAKDPRIDELTVVFKPLGDRWAKYYRWIPMEYEDFSVMLFPCDGPARGAFFVRIFEIEMEFKEEE